MAQLILTTAASAFAKSAGANLLVSTLIGTAASAVGGFIDKSLFGRRVTREVEGPRLDTLNILSASEGSPITRVFGRARLSGEVIWATRLREEIVTESTTTSSGKGGGSSVKSTTATVTEYLYYANFAVAICEGEIVSITNVKADGKDLDLGDYTHRIYTGSETQDPDSLIEAKEGSGNAPAYRGVAYIVFEDMPLKKFGNRIPQLQFEVTRPIAGTGVESKIKGVNLIPGSTEFGYDSMVIKQQYGDADNGTLQIRPENNYLGRSVSDFSVALDNLVAALPNLETVCLVVAWFGDDLRAGSCTIRPKVESSSKQTTPITWSVDGLTRSTALVISTSGGRAAYGGTPNDTSVIRCIQAIKAKGLKVCFLPFLLMDIASGNTKPNPYSANAATNGQAAYPWRGRITCSPAPGYTGTVDKTATAATQISTFYNGTWGYKRFIEHYADLCASAGGVDQFLIGSEMGALTTVRSATATFPFVTHLIALAASCAAKLPSAEIGYAANWDEYHSYRPDDGTGDVYFHLDDLWTDSNIDFIGIDNYMPMSDWRDDPSSLDGAAYGSIYNIDYLKSNIEGGEYADWYYASAADRDSETRTPITDGVYGKPWVFANKKIRDWWLNAHYNRPGGVESGTPTAWTAQGKKIVFVEVGCPAVDKGTNEPNVFVDAKSAESDIPHYSTGARDDLIQRQALLAFHDYWNANNPTSSVYGGPMIDMASSNVWCWDARPAPVFPYDLNVYSDGVNWERGHWISNRLGTAPIQAVLEELIAPYSIDDWIDFADAYGSVDGLVLDRPMSFRQAVSGLELFAFFDFVEIDGLIKVISKTDLPQPIVLTDDDIVMPVDREPVLVERAQLIDLPNQARLTFQNSGDDFRRSVVQARRETTLGVRVANADLGLIIDMARAEQAVYRWLYSLYAENETLSFGLMPRLKSIAPGSTVNVQVGNSGLDGRVIQVKEAGAREVRALSFDRSIFQGNDGVQRSTPTADENTLAQPIIRFIDGPLQNDADIEHAAYAAAFGTPWSGVSIYRSLSEENYALNTYLYGPAIIGVTRFDFFSGPEGRYDYGNKLFVQLYSGSLQSVEEPNLLAGANMCAIQNEDDEWEYVQFQNATLESGSNWLLDKLIRGCRGTEFAMRDPVAAGASVVFFNLAVQQLEYAATDRGVPYYLRSGPSARPITDDLYATQLKTFLGNGLKPLSPDHIRARKTTGNDLTFSWKRRTRLGGDAWDYVTDVPLSEASEAYELDIMDGSDVVRTITASSQSANYSEAQQIADFGSVQSFYIVNLYQISETVGRGYPRLRIVYPEG